MRRHAWFGAVILIALVAYLPSFTAAFQFDDYSHIVGNAAAFASLQSLLAFAHSRVIPIATLALNYRIGGEQPFDYHVVNFGIHLAATATVYLLALALCRTPRLRGTWLADAALPLAVGTAFVFACHPIQIQAVTYIVQRISSLATLFYVGSILLYVRARNAELGLEAGRPRVRYAGAVLLALGAFLSKENSVSLPLAVVLVEWAFYGGRLTASRALRVLPLLAYVLVIPVLWMRVGEAPPAIRQSGLMRLLAFRAAPVGHLSPLDYFLTQCLVIPRYLGLVALPWGFNVDHDVPAATGLSPAVAGGLGFLVVLLGFGLYAVRRWPMLGFGIVWVFVTLSVESSFFPILDVMVEHRMYLAMPGIALVLGTGFAWAFRRRRTVAGALGAVIVVALSTLTFLRNEVWQAPLTLWRDALDKSPGKLRVVANFGTALHFQGKYREAIAYYCQVLASDPENPQARTNLDIALEQERDAQLNAGAEIALDAVTIGPDGTLELAPRDPCVGSKGRSK